MSIFRHRVSPSAHAAGAAAAGAAAQFAGARLFPPAAVPVAVTWRHDAPRAYAQILVPPYCSPFDDLIASAPDVSAARRAGAGAAIRDSKVVESLDKVVRYRVVICTPI
ncbi:hypothetical protein EVAR_40884_1 [Eumeta japonica]|uniref:Uncharacterized protein n=1 Tax=Eumeta variegata TaxID=151549 RepID=A0A4C1X6D2_EUMVA|nr:hypothetical protein EVAR_40884_1 [Eumeta japonica]